MKRKVWAPLLGVIVAVCALSVGAVTALGSTGSAGSASAVGSAASAKITGADIKLGVSYTGGTASKATKSPIEIGLVNPNIGDIADPQNGAAAHSAVLFINNYLGGVDGHPIKLVSCTFGATAQQGQECGEQFGNSKAITAVLYTVSSAGDTQLAAANAGRKVYFCMISSPTDANVKNKFCTVGGPLGIGDFVTYIADDLHAKNLAYMTLADPAISGLISLVQPIFTKAGVTMKTAEEPTGVTDATSTVLASGLQTADAGWVMVSTPADCVPFVKAIEALHPKTPVVGFSSCQYAPVNGKIANWTFPEYGPINDSHEADYDQYVAYNDVTLAYRSQTGNAQSDETCQSFGETLLMDKILNEVGASNLTTAKIAAKMKAYTGGLFCGDPHEKFGVQPDPSVGSLRSLFFTHNSNGTWTAANGGKWVSPPK